MWPASSKTSLLGWRTWTWLHFLGASAQIKCVERHHGDVSCHVISVNTVRAEEKTADQERKCKKLVATAIQLNEWERANESLKDPLPACRAAWRQMRGSFWRDFCQKVSWQGQSSWMASKWVGLKWVDYQYMQMQLLRWNFISCDGHTIHLVQSIGYATLPSILCPTSHLLRDLIRHLLRISILRGSCLVSGAFLTFTSCNAICYTSVAKIAQWIKYGWDFSISIFWLFASKLVL